MIPLSALPSVVPVQSRISVRFSGKKYQPPQELKPLYDKKPIGVLKGVGIFLGANAIFYSILLPVLYFTDPHARLKIQQATEAVKSFFTSATNQNKTSISKEVVTPEKIDH